MKRVFIQEKMSVKAVEEQLNNQTIMDKLTGTDRFFRKESNGKFSVRFVGKVLLQEKGSDPLLLYSLPKYIDPKVVRGAANDPSTAQELQKHMNTLLEVLLKLEKHQSEIAHTNIFSAANKNTSKDIVDKISLAEYIIKDYVNHGLYCENKRVVGTQSKGKILWSHTIRHCQPYIDEDTVLYTKLMRKYQVYDDSQLITHIHASVVRYAYDLLSVLDRCPSTITLPSQKSLEEKDLPHLVRLVQSYMRRAVSNRDIFLFRAIEAWCRDSFYYTTLMLGTSSFELVWQDVNDRVYGKQTNKNSSHPTYHFWTDDSQNTAIHLTGTGDARIDTMFVTKKNKEWWVSIFDAKYYVPEKINQKTVSGYPPNSDVAKQIGYLDIIRRSYGDKAHYSNAFLLPAVSDRMIDSFSPPPILKTTSWRHPLYCVPGFVTRGDFGSQSESDKKTAPSKPDNTESDNTPVQSKRDNTDSDNAPVLLIHVSPDKLYDAFLKGEAITMDDVEYIHEMYGKALNACQPKKDTCGG